MIDPLRKICICLLVAAALPLLSHGEVAPSVINGTPTTDYPSVGVVSLDGSLAAGFCSGTLIAPDRVLTAAHCTWGEDPDSLFFRLGDNVYAVSQIYIHPDYDIYRFGTNQANDVSILVLAEPVPDVTPSPILRDRPRRGDTLILVGFGEGGTGSEDGGTSTGDFGTKRVGATPLQRVTRTLLWWRFDDNSESNTAPGDSGGPSFIERDGVLHVGGVTSGGAADASELGGYSVNTRVDAYEDWIDHPVNGPKVLVYQYRQLAHVVDADGSRRQVQRGFFVHDVETDALFDVALERSGRQWLAREPVLVQDQAETVFMSTLDLGFGRSAALWGMAQASADEAVVSPVYGRTRPVRRGLPRLLSGADQSFAITTAGALSSGRLLVRFSARHSRQLTVDDTAEAVATDLYQASAPATSSEATPPLQAASGNDDPTIVIHRLSGRDHLAGQGLLDRQPVRGFLIVQGSTDTAIVVLGVGRPGDGFVYSLALSDGEHGYNVVVPDRRWDRHVLAMATTDTGWIQTIHLTGLARPGHAPRRYQGMVNHMLAATFSGIAYTTALRTRLDRQRTAEAAGQDPTVIRAALEFELRQRYDLD